MEMNNQFETWWHKTNELTGKNLDDCYPESKALAAFCFTAGMMAQHAAFDKIFDSKNDHLFTSEAAHKAYGRGDL